MHNVFYFSQKCSEVCFVCISVYCVEIGWSKNNDERRYLIMLGTNLYSQPLGKLYRNQFVYPDFL